MKGNFAIHQFLTNNKHFLLSISNILLDIYCLNIHVDRAKKYPTPEDENTVAADYCVHLILLTNMWSSVDIIDLFQFMINRLLTGICQNLLFVLQCFLPCTVQFYFIFIFLSSFFQPEMLPKPKLDL